MAFSLDSATSARLALLYPDFRARLIRTLQDVYTATGRQMRLLEGIRTFEQQARDFAQGRTAPGKIITNARPGYSFHAYGIAADCVFMGADPYLEQMALKDPKGSDAAWETFARLGEGNGLYAGRRFPKVDSDHLEAHYGGMRIQDVLEVYQVGGIRGVWMAFDKIRGIPPGAEWDTVANRSPLLALDSKVRQRDP